MPYRSTKKAALTSLGMDTKELDVKIKEHIRRYGRFCDVAKVPHSKANIRYDGSTSDITKTKAYHRYQEMMKNADGKQIKQITNNNHGTPKSHPWGINGEHAHDYIWENETLKSRPGRELTEIERKENTDIL